ncbi:MAG: ATP-binding protein [Rhodopila sp.]|nr:ATP-binding protein [Rhodopila sp.]
MNFANINEELRARLQQQEILADIGAFALKGGEPDGLLQETTRLVAVGLQTSFCKILEYRPDEDQFLVRAGVGWRDGVVGHARIGAALASPAGYTLKTGKPTISNVLASESRFQIPKLLLDHGIRRAINVIIRCGDADFGVLEADSGHPGDFEQRDLAFLQGAANLLGVALDRKRTEAALKQFTDTLEQRVAERTHALAEANTRLLAVIAERRNAESALMQAQRLEAIGQLTGGIAHDFNNLLAAVIGNLELLRPAQTAVRSQMRVDAALKAARRGGELTGQLLAYARKQHVDPRPLDANAAMTGILEMLRRSLGGLQTIETDLAPDLWSALADPVQLESIVLNLAINARDAMPDGGRLRITTRNASAADNSLPPELEHRDYVLISVSDEGSGMPPDVLAKAFEPFFTTKEIGKGSGLGLAQVHGVARQFGGTARLSSTLGVGTVVEVFLPRAVGAQPAAGKTDAPSSAAPMAGAPVLIIDDQDDVRAVAAAFLEDAGYTVREANSGAAGLVALEAGPISLALVDHGMAGMSGLEFVRKARQRHPALRVIYLTGNAEPLDAAGVDQTDTVLSKPYGPDALLAAVRRAIAGDGGTQP